MAFSYNNPIFFIFGTFSSNFTVFFRFLIVMFSLVMALLLLNSLLIFSNMNLAYPTFRLVV